MTDPEVLRRIVAGVNVGTERKKVKEEREARNTYLSHASDTELELGGRYSKLLPTQVTGREPVVTVPKQPEGSPWHSDPVGTEPFIDGTGDGNQLGYRIDGSQEPVEQAKPDATRPAVVSGRVRRRV
jgi:hypothetical protein